jgi:molecular chaperone GrpE
MNEKNETKEKKAPETEKMITVSESEYLAMQKELDGYKDKYLRLFAEFENARKRFDRDRIEFVKYANEGVIKDFLNILDDLERTVAVANDKHHDYEAFLKGVELVMAQVYDLLKKNHVAPIESVGKKYDPHSHEALMQVESADYEDGVVIEEFQKGYYFNDRVIRTAKVKVALNNSPIEKKAPPEEPEGPIGGNK